MTGQHWWQQGKKCRHIVQSRVSLIGVQCCALALATCLYVQTRGVPPVRQGIDLAGAALIPALIIVILCAAGLLAQYVNRKRLAAKVLVEEQAQALPCHDALTGLATQATLIEAMRNLSAAAWGSDAVSVLAIDLIRLKSINEHFGPAAGDAVLVATAKRLRKLVGPLGVVGRLDGNALACVVPHPPGSDRPARLAVEMNDAFARPIEFRDDILVIGSKVAIATFICADLAPETALASTRAMLENGAPSDSAGCSIHQTMPGSTASSHSLEAEIRRGILRGEFVPYYEPIVDPRSGTIIGFESLARWQHPSGGMVMPDDFMPVAESAGLVAELNFALLRLACDDARQWPEQMKLAVAMSPLQFDDPRLAHRVLATLDIAGIAANRLVIEIAEGHVIANVGIARAIIACLSQAGVQIALDALGLGDADLNQLRDLKFDRLRPDRQPGREIGLSRGYAISRTEDTFGESYFFSRPVPGPEALLIATAAALPPSRYRNAPDVTRAMHDAFPALHDRRQHTRH